MNFFLINENLVYKYIVRWSVGQSTKDTHINIYIIVGTFCLFNDRLQTFIFVIIEQVIYN